MALCAEASAELTLPSHWVNIFFEARPARVRAMAGLVFAIGLASESRLRSPAWLRECV